MNPKLEGTLWDSGSVGSTTTGPTRTVKPWNLHSYQVVGSSPDGTFVIQVSNDGTIWTDITSEALSGSAIVYADCWNFTYARWKWTHTSGTVQIIERHDG